MYDCLNEIKIKAIVSEVNYTDLHNMEPQYYRSKYVRNSNACYEIKFDECPTILLSKYIIDLGRCEILQINNYGARCLKIFNDDTINITKINNKIYSDFDINEYANIFKHDIASSKIWSFFGTLIVALSLASFMVAFADCIKCI
jgi:hypothetical protein